MDAEIVENDAAIGENDPAIRLHKVKNKIWQIFQDFQLDYNQGC